MIKFRVTNFHAESRTYGAPAARPRLAPRPTARRQTSFRAGVETLDRREVLSTLALTSATVEPDGRTLQLVFSGTLPSKFTTPDWAPGAAQGLQLTTGSGVPLEQIGNFVTTPGPGDVLVWTADYLVTDPTKAVTFGATGVTLQAGAGLLQDSAGNATAAFSGFAAANTSLVDANGFTSQSLQRGAGGATLYVSSTYGNDSDTFAQAQNPATPLKSLTQALSLVSTNGMNGKGAAIRLLDGDTFTGGGAIKVNGQDAQHPFVIENYWYQYTPGATDPQTRPVVAVDESSPNGPSAALFTYGGGGTPSIISNILVRNISFQAVNWTGNYSGRYGLQFLVPGSNWTLDNDVVQNFGTNINFQASSGSLANVTLLRCTVADARIDNAVTSGHPEGMYMDHVTSPLISQCTFDDNGRVSADRTGRDIFSHNIYMQSTDGPGLVWGNSITSGGSHGLQLRGGGVVAYNYFGGNAIAAFIDGVGGTFYKNVVEDAQDISAASPRGFGLSLQSTTANVSETAELNIIVNASGSTPQGIAINQGPTGAGYGTLSSLIRHNTVYKAGGLAFSPGALYGTTPATVVNAQNLYAVASGSVYSASPYTTLSSIFSYQNDLPASPYQPKSVIVGNTNMTLATWAANTGTEVGSMTTSPAFANPDNGLGSYAINLSLPDASSSASAPANRAAYIAALRARGASAWPTASDMTQVYGYFSSTFTPTNLVVSSGSYFGASPYTSTTGSTPVLTATAGFRMSTLTWTPVQYASYYNVYSSRNGDAEFYLGQTSQTSYQQTGLWDSAVYTYRVVPVFGSAAGTSSGTTSVTTPAAVIDPYGVTTSITGTAGSGKVSLSWAGVRGALSYQLYQVVGDGSLSKVTNTTQLSMTIGSLYNGTTYVYQVVPVFSTGLGGLSNKVSLLPSSV